MPQPKQVDAAADELVRLYREAQDRLIDRYATLVDSPRLTAQQARIRELLRAVDAELAHLHASTSDWAATRLPAIYQTGAVQAAIQIGSGFAWAPVHRDAVQALAQTMWDDLLGRTGHVADDTKRSLRTLARSETRAALLESKTAVGAARDFAAEAQQAGIFTVKYANRAVHTVADYADTVIRTTTANAYNQGSLVQSREEGIRYMRCFDGANCGLTAHGDGDKVNGRVFPIDTADAYPIAHPRCVMPETRVKPYGDLLEIVRADYSGPSFRITFAAPSGSDDLTVGPYHPVLTRTGWKPAHLIAEGDELIYDLWNDDACDGRLEPDLQQMPTAADLFESSRGIGACTLAPATGNDLHGDGMFCQGEIDVVRPALGLLPVADPGRVEQYGELVLMRSDVGSDVTDRLGVANPFFPAVGAPTNGTMCSSGDFDSLALPSLLIHEPPIQLLGFTDRPGDSHRPENIADMGSLSSDQDGDLLTVQFVSDVQPTDQFPVDRLAFHRTIPGASGVTRLDPEHLSARLTLDHNRLTSASLLETVETTEPPTLLGGEQLAARLTGNRGPGCFGHRFLTAPVIAVEVGWHSGSVYDLTTNAGVFSASQILVKNCARSWSPEPFISTKADAENARQFDTERQATMAAEEAARAATATVPLAGRRLGRTARQPRTARTSR